VAWSKLIDMEMDDEDVLDHPMPISMPERASYPYGLRICLTHRELKKLGLDADCEVGDMIDLRAFATVTSVSTSDDGNSGAQCRIELQIEKLAVEDEMTEKD
jgi:hypothetical protein